MAIYPFLQELFSIHFKQNFPYDILSWSETYPSGSGEDAIVLTTKTHRTHSVMTDYWNKNSVKDLELREELGLAK